MLPASAPISPKHKAKYIILQIYSINSRKLSLTELALDWNVALVCAGLCWSVLVFAGLFRSAGGNCAFTFRAQINPWSVSRFSFSHSLFKLSFPSCIDKPSSSLNCAARLHFSFYFYFHFYCSFHFHFIFLPCKVKAAEVSKDCKSLHF